MIAATEDSWAQTIIPRLKAADADLTRVARVEVTGSDGGQTSLCLPRDVAALTQAVRDTETVLVLLDPLISRLDGKLDTHKDAEVRQALEPLVRLADDSGAVVLGIIHVNKGSSRDPLNMVMGSRAFTAVARAVLFVAEDPDDEEKVERVLGQVKNNLGRSDLPTLTFAIEDTHVATTADGEIRTGKLKWTGQTVRSIRDVVEEAGASTADRTAKAEAASWLRVFLLQRRGVVESKVIREEGAKAGHSESALKRARKTIAVSSETTKQFPRRTFWLLPGKTLDLCALAGGGIVEPDGPQTRADF
jgi:hypothetical protein